jgi:hypothetical protein
MEGEKSHDICWLEQALIDAFKGTARDCFDGSNQYRPIARPRA